MHSHVGLEGEVPRMGCEYDRDSENGRIEGGARGTKSASKYTTDDNYGGSGWGPIGLSPAVNPTSKPRLLDVGTSAPILQEKSPTPRIHANTFLEL